MQIKIDEEKCIGAGQCAVAAPDVFSQRDDDGVVVLLEANPSPDQYDAVRAAAAACPAAVILIEE